MSEQNWLKKLKVWAVALVDHPANPEAQVVFWKAGKTKKVDGKDLPSSAFAHVGNPDEPSSWNFPIHDEKHARLAVQMWSKASADHKSPEAHKKILAAAKRYGIEVAKVDQTPEPSNDPGAESGHYGDEDDKRAAGTMPVECDICGGDHATGDHEAQVAKQPGLGDVHTPGSQSAQDETDERERGEYGHDAPQTKRDRSMDTQAGVEKVASLQKKLDDAAKANAELVSRVEKMEARQRRDHYISKAALYKHIPGALPEDFGPILAKIDAVLNQEERDRFDGVLKATEAALRQAAIFQEFGRSGEGPANEPGVQLTKLAKDKQKAEPALSFAKAYELALRENPTIYSEYLKSAEQKGR